MKTMNLMIKPASALCNLRCKYCFYADVSARRCVSSHGIMQEATVKAMLEFVLLELQEGDRVHFAFQGGEPTLAGLPFFKAFVSLVCGWKGIEVSYALQTNGILLDAEWCAFLAEHHFLVGLSLDLLPDAHDSVRVDAGGNGTYSRVKDTLTLLKKFGVECNVLCTLTSEIARHPKQVWDRVTALGIEYVQFTPCLGDLDTVPPSPYALTPARFASFYTRLFGLWYEDFQKGKRRSVKLFDDVVNQLVLGRPTGCGMNGVCQPQLVVEADGSAYPCDFYCLDEFRLGNITENKVSELLSSSGLEAFLGRTHSAPRLCRDCRYRAFCGGNCKRMQREICCVGEDGFCGYQSFLDACGAPLARLAEQIRRSRYTKKQ